MIKSITVTNYLNKSIKLELTRPEKSGFIIKSIDGLGPAKATINSSEIATNDGGIFNSARLNQRNITMSLVFCQTDKETIEDVRQKSYKYFPIRRKVYLTIETDNLTLETVGYVESNEPNIFTKESGANISIICPDPFLYTKELDEHMFNGVIPLFEFPFSNESLDEPLLEMGSLNVNTEKCINYKGDSEVGITIHMHALSEVTNITIENADTREVMILNTDKLSSLTGSGIIAGDDIIIDTQKGSKSIMLLRDGVYTNILNCLEKGSKWFTLKKGDNIFMYSAETGASSLQFRITNKVAYDGV